MLIKMAIRMLFMLNLLVLFYNENMNVYLDDDDYVDDHDGDGNSGIGDDDDPRTDHEMVILFWTLQIFRGNENEFFGEFYGDGMLEVRVDESDDLIS